MMAHAFKLCTCCKFWTSPGLHREFWAGLDYIVSLYLKKEKKLDVITVGSLQESFKLIYHLGSKGRQMSVHLRLAWSKKQVPSHPGYCEPLLPERKKKNFYKLYSYFYLLQIKLKL